MEVLQVDYEKMWQQLKKRVTADKERYENDIAQSMQATGMILPKPESIYGMTECYRMLALMNLFEEEQAK